MEVVEKDLWVSAHIITSPLQLGPSSGSVCAFPPTASLRCPLHLANAPIFSAANSHVFPGAVFQLLLVVPGHRTEGSRPVLQLPGSI